MTKQKDELAEYLFFLAKTYVGEVLAEHRFHPERKWRFDWAIPKHKIAIEYDGIMKRTVGHNSLAGILRDAEKINEAQRLGWRVFRANAKNIDDGTFFTLMDDVLFSTDKEQTA